MTPMATVLPSILFFTRFPSFFKAGRVWIFRAFYNGGPASVNRPSVIKPDYMRQASGIRKSENPGSGKIKGVNGTGKNQKQGNDPQMCADESKVRLWCKIVLGTCSFVSPIV
jgi:hypothetical protein